MFVLNNVSNILKENLIISSNMNLRQGRTKSILEASRDSALLAVEIYNKPRTTFRSEAFITLMIMAWTRLFHAYFHKTIGEKYFYKKKGTNRYEVIEGEKRAWDLKTCVKKYKNLSDATEKNLEFFIQIRNKIEHRHIDDKIFDMKIFGECQSLLFNYENELTKLFGNEYALNESLAYSLQFSSLRTDQQKLSNKKMLSREMKEIDTFIMNFRNKLSEVDFNSQEYAIKLIQIPKVSGSNRADLAVEFVNWNSLTPEEKESVSKLTTIVREKTITKFARNWDCIKPSQVVKEVKKVVNEFTINDLKIFCILFNIRPYGNDIADPFDTNEEFCFYDELHGDYVYTKEWPKKIIEIIQENKWIKSSWRSRFRRGERLKI